LLQTSIEEISSRLSVILGPFVLLIRMLGTNVIVTSLGLLRYSWGDNLVDLQCSVIMVHFACRLQPRFLFYSTLYILFPVTVLGGVLFIFFAALAVLDPDDESHANGTIAAGP
jgi:hypothetical protein